MPGNHDDDGCPWTREASFHWEIKGRFRKRVVLANVPSFRFFGFGKRGLLEKGSFQRSPFSRDSREFRDSRDFREPQTLENKGESDHFLEILENLEILEILEIPPVKRPLS